MKRIAITARWALVFLMLFSMTSSSLSAEELTNIPASITTVQNLVEWLSHEFSYRMEFPNTWQSPNETIKTKEGDCEDFAVLASAFLGKIGVRSDIAIVSFKGMDTSHALCVWKNKDESYSFISNRKLYRSGKSTLEDAVGRYYPDWNKIVIASAKNEYIKVIRRK